ncbi:glycosyltransferase [Paraburkholderia pallida]|nr:glycosyltransferase [Paraburkholderia pallida]
MAPESQTKYTAAFYTQHLSGSARSAHAILSRLFDYLHPSSVLDVGCGYGTWLKAAHDLGIRELQGFDGSYVDREAFLVAPSHFTATDLSQEFSTSHRYDLAISVEVAEHLPITRASGFVRDLCKTSDVVLFSAAPPYQGGEDHLNEQWPEYWGILFRQFGYRCFDLFRSESWDSSDVESWYAQNAFLFVKADNPLCEQLSKFASDDRVLSKVHPEIYLINVTRYRPDASAQLEAELDAWHSITSAFRSGALSLPGSFQSPGQVPGQANPLTQGRQHYQDSAAARADFVTANTELTTVRTELNTASTELSTARAELVSARAELTAHAAAKARQSLEIEDLHGQLVEVRESADHKLRVLRDERNNALNALIETSVLALEVKEQENRTLADALEAERNTVAQLSHVVSETSQALDTVKRESALIKQATSLPHVVARALPSPLRKLARLVRDELDVRYLRSTSHFDSLWYLSQNHDVQAAGIDPLRHYVKYGAIEGRNPRADFDTRQFLVNRARTRRPRRNIFVEYLKWHNGQSRLTPIKTGEIRSSALAYTPPLAIENSIPTQIATGWYGAKRLAQDQLFNGGDYAKVDANLHDQQTKLIVDRFLSDVNTEDVLSPVNGFAPLDSIRQAFQNTTTSASVTLSAKVPTYTIITPFFSHLDFFKKTAESVADLIKNTPPVSHTQRIEWIVINDDPRFDAAALQEVIPADIRSATLVISDGFNRGISARQNQGIDAASNEWLLFLDCDDLLEKSCISVLDHYISNFPRCRFISSSIIDIDESDAEIRRRIRGYGAEGLYEKGMNAGHLAAIRRDLFDDIGRFDQRFSGCQDYDLALRAAIREPILLVPEHLYSYRWHTKTQSVAQFKKQAQIAEAVRRAFLQHFIEHNWPDVRQPSDLPSNARGICLIRTQGRRLELLEETVNSVLHQTVQVTPCIIVHGKDAALKIVQQWAAERFGDQVEILQADLPGRRRGYPLNVGLDFVEANVERFDFFCILDDDDIYYPMFAERLLATLRLNGADVAYCTTNSRVPGQQPKSAHPPLPTAALVAGNFIPINAYIVRTELLIKSGARMREDIHYLEDWDFLLSLMYANGNFTLLNETLSEFRIIGDGNTEQRNDPKHFKHCEKIVNARSRLVAKQVGMAEFYRDLLAFDFSARPAFSVHEKAHVKAALDLFLLVARPLDMNNK